MPNQLFPEVRDISNVGAKPSSDFILPLGVEGWADVTGTAVAGTVYTINRVTEAQTFFGANSVLTALLTFLLGRGVAPIYAVPSVVGGTAPTLIQRQAAWAVLEAHPLVRLRMTSDTAQATLVALAASCDNANLVYNKQIGFGGMAAGTAKAALQSAAQAIASKRFVFIGPGVVDQNGNLLSGNYAAAMVAAAVARNPDITDDLDLALMPNIVGIELATSGLPLFTKRVVSGVAVNDFEDLLQQGVSPIMSDPTGLGARITHLRTTWTGSPPGTDSTFDALETRLIVDQVFIDVKNYCTNNGFLRKGNTQKTRDDLRAGIDALLRERSAWIQPITQMDGTQGYNVTVVPTSDMRGVIVRYEGTVVRNVQTVDVDAELSIPV